MTLPLKKKALLSLAVTVCTLGAAEIGLRLFGFKFMPKEIPLVIWNVKEDRLFDSAQALHRMDPDCLWTPQPLAMIPWSPGESINAHSYRGPLLKVNPKTPPFRVAFLGDSSTFGWEVDFEQTYAARCTASLNEAGTPTEPLNAGVIGYSILQGLSRYRTLVRNYKPDVVVLAFGAVNDHYAAPSLEPDHEKIQKLTEESAGFGRAGRWLRENLRIAHFVDSMRFKRNGGMKALRKRYRESRKREFASLAEVGKKDYSGVRRVSLVEYRRYLEELVAEIRDDGARVILLCMPRKIDSEGEAPVLVDYSHATEAAATHLQAPLIDLRSHFRSYGKIYEGGLFFDNWHPRPRGHRLIAEDLLPLLTSIADELGHPVSAEKGD